MGCEQMNVCRLESSFPTFQSQGFSPVAEKLEPSAQLRHDTLEEKLEDRNSDEKP